MNFLNFWENLRLKISKLFDQLTSTCSLLTLLSNETMEFLSSNSHKPSPSTSEPRICEKKHEKLRSSLRRRSEGNLQRKRSWTGKECTWRNMIPRPDSSRSLLSRRWSEMKVCGGWWSATVSCSGSFERCTRCYPIWDVDSAVTSYDVGHSWTAVCVRMARFAGHNSFDAAETRLQRCFRFSTKFGCGLMRRSTSNCLKAARLWGSFRSSDQFACLVCANSAKENKKTWVKVKQSCDDLFNKFVVFCCMQSDFYRYHRKRVLTLSISSVLSKIFVTTEIFTAGKRTKFSSSRGYATFKMVLLFIESSKQLERMKSEEIKAESLWWRKCGIWKMETACLWIEDLIKQLINLRDYFISRLQKVFTQCNLNFGIFVRSFIIAQSTVSLIVDRIIVWIIR
jgi:hypothetical protein